MADQIRILFTIPNFITAGSGRVLANIVERLDRAKYIPTVCVSRRGGQIEAELELQGMQVIEFPFTVSARPYMTLMSRVHQAAQAFKPLRFDLWHSFHYADDYSEPLIAHLAGVKAWVYTKKSMMWGSRAWIVRSLLAKKIVADNNDMPRMFFNRYNLSKKVQVIPHGVDINQFKPISVDNNAYRFEHGLSKESFLVGLVAHLVPVKGHAFLIEAAAQLPQVHLMFAGRADDQAYFAHLKTLVQAFGISHRVHFLGNVTDVPEFLAQMDIIVMPTVNRGEGCPVALLEAMACGKACVATDVPGSNDIIEDGVSGLLVKSEDAQTLVHGIRQLFEDPLYREKLEVTARKRIVDHFSIEREVQAYQALYEAL